MHREIAARTADLALAAGDAPLRVLDVGCGTGLLLRLLAAQLPEAERVIGPSTQFSEGVAEKLRYPDDSFDLVVSSVSFDHWENRARESASVLGSWVLAVTWSSQTCSLPCSFPLRLSLAKTPARTRHRAEALLKAAGFRTMTWHNLYGLIISTVVASK